MPGTSADFSSCKQQWYSTGRSILYVMPSAIDYGGTIISKQLTIYTGLAASSVRMMRLQQTTEVSASVNGIWFKPGSSNSIVEGLTIKYQQRSPGICGCLPRLGKYGHYPAAVFTS